MPQGGAQERGRPAGVAITGLGLGLASTHEPRPGDGHSPTSVRPPCRRPPDPLGGRRSHAITMTRAGRPRGDRGTSKGGRPTSPSLAAGRPTPARPSGAPASRAPRGSVHAGPPRMPGARFPGAPPWPPARRHRAKWASTGSAAKLAVRGQDGWGPGEPSRVVSQRLPLWGRGRALGGALVPPNRDQLPRPWEDDGGARRLGCRRGASTPSGPSCPRPRDPLGNPWRHSGTMIRAGCPPADRGH